MKKCALVMALVLIIASFCCIPAFAGYATAKAAGAVNAPGIDCVKDEIYSYSTPLEIPEGGGAHGKIYFAYDDEYLYVYAEIEDATVAPQLKKSDNITPVCKADSLLIGLNLDNSTGDNDQYNDIRGEGKSSNSADTKSQYYGVYAIPRGVTGNRVAIQGTHSWMNAKKWESASVSTETGYLVETKIAWGTDYEGEMIDTAPIFENGISILLALHDSDEGAGIAKTDLDSGTFYSSNSSVRSPRGKAYSFSDSEPSWDKLEFGEKIDVPAATAAVTTQEPKVTTVAPKITTVAPKITTAIPKITTAIPVLTTATPTSLESSAPVTTEITTIAEEPVTSITSLALTSVSEVTEHESTPISAESSGNTTVIIAVAAIVAAVVIAAVTFAVMKKKNKSH